jgi:hypothetical protein
MRTWFWWERQKEIELSEDFAVGGGRIILKLIEEK